MSQMIRQAFASMCRSSEPSSLKHVLARCIRVWQSNLPAFATPSAFRLSGNVQPAVLSGVESRRERCFRTLKSSSPARGAARPTRGYSPARTAISSRNVLTEKGWRPHSKSVFFALWKAQDPIRVQNTDVPRTRLNQVHLVDMKLENAIIRYGTYQLEE